MLQLRHPQSLHARSLNAALPRCEFLKRQTIALTHFVDRQQTAVHRRDDFCLAARNPAGRVWWREAVERQRLAQGTNHLRRSDLLVLDQCNPRSSVRQRIVCAEQRQPSRLHSVTFLAVKEFWLTKPCIAARENAGEIAGL